MFLGNVNYARVVGNILHENSDGEKYPCYKEVNAQGKLAENYAFGGLDAQKQRLEKEGIVVNEGRVDLSVYKWKV